MWNKKVVFNWIAVLFLPGQHREERGLVLRCVLKGFAVRGREPSLRVVWTTSPFEELRGVWVRGRLGATGLPPPEWWRWDGEWWRGAEARPLFHRYNLDLHITLNSKDVQQGVNVHQHALNNIRQWFRLQLNITSQFCLLPFATVWAGLGKWPAEEYSKHKILLRIYLTCKIQNSVDLGIWNTKYNTVF
jgi:hypothetical protein